jgi:hypothetical protein
MADTQHPVGSLVRRLKQERLLRSDSTYSNAPERVYEYWQQLSPEQQTWITLTLTPLELLVLAGIQRIHSRRSAEDLINLIKNRSVTEQLARKLGIKEE